MNNSYKQKKLEFKVIVENKYPLSPGDVIYNYDGERIGYLEPIEYRDKQKKDWEKEFDKIFENSMASSLDVFEGSISRLKLFILNLIDETEKQAEKEFEKERILFRKHEIEDLERCRKQAQSEMREDLIKWISDKKKEYRGKLTDNEISRFSPQADVYCEALDDILTYL